MYMVHHEYIVGNCVLCLEVQPSIVSAARRMYECQQNRPRLMGSQVHPCELSHIRKVNATY
jgi:hypothetical protein